jgi:hypothetical protein
VDSVSVVAGSHGPSSAASSHAKAGSLATPQKHSARAHGIVHGMEHADGGEHAGRSPNRSAPSQQLPAGPLHPGAFTVSGPSPSARQSSAPRASHETGYQPPSRRPPPDAHAANVHGANGARTSWRQNTTFDSPPPSNLPAGGFTMTPSNMAASLQPRSTSLAEPNNGQLASGTYDAAIDTAEAPIQEKKTLFGLFGKARSSRPSEMGGRGEGQEGVGGEDDDMDPSLKELKCAPVPPRQTCISCMWTLTCLCCKLFAALCQVVCRVHATRPAGAGGIWHQQQPHFSSSHHLCTHSSDEALLSLHAATRIYGGRLLTEGDGYFRGGAKRCTVALYIVRATTVSMLPCS